MVHPQCLAHQSFRLPSFQPAKQRRSCHKSRFRAMAVAAEPKPRTKISRTDLIEYMRSGCRPKEQWRFGTEHEKLGYFVDSHRRIDHEAISKLLHQICTRFSWQPIMEKGNIIGATLENASVTLEPGGQFELSGAPLDSLHKTCSEVNSHLYEVKTIAEELGLAFLTCGFDPKWKYEEVPIMPKYRYKIMREYMPKVGTMGHDMMFRSTTIQVNIDFSSEQDMIEKARVGLALQPVCTALFANSPLKEGKPTGYLSWRSHVWTDVDDARCGTLPFVFDPDFGFERYVDYALQVPMYFVYRNGEYVDVSGEDFRQFMEGNLQQLPGDTPSLADWETHLTCIFPEIRLKRFLEMRGADGGPQSMICALSALWVGLLYDEQSQAAALDLISDWTREDHEQLRRDVPRLALKTPFRGGTVQDLAIRMVELSREGLQRRRKAEENFLAPLVEIAESGVTQAERLLEEYHQNGDSVDFVFGKEHYF